MAGVVADKVIVELEAKLDRYNANVRAAEARFDTATKNIQRSAQQVERSMQRSTTAIGNQLRGLAATFATAFSVQQVAQLADGYTRFTNQLKVAGVEGDRLGRTQNDLFLIAQKYGVELETLGGLYGKLTQAGGELGANQSEILKFTNGVAAALKIQGGAASESRGALIQLSQALGGEIVRAEEFNSINEGARPILQAVAKGVDRFGGSVAKLRREVVDGKVTSEEFFRGFLKGSGDLQAQAEKANLTIAASFTILNNALGKYIGETDDSLSATERVSAAIIALSENLDTVVEALSLLAVILGSRYIVALGRAAAATGVVSTAIFAMQARAIGAATTMEALALAGATAGRTLLAAFGGPVGLAITALAGGLYYLSTQAEIAGKASGEYAQMEERATNVRNKASDAADALANATGRARTASLANAQAVREETVQYLAQARAALVAAQAKARAAGIESRARTGGALQGPPGNPLRAAAIMFGLGGTAENQVAAANVQAAEKAVKEAEAALKEIDAALKAPPAVRTSSPGDGKKTKAKKGPKGTDPDEIARRFADDLARGAAEYEQAMAEVTGTLEDRLGAERHQIRAQQEITARAINADKDLSAAQKAQLLELNDQIANARVEATHAEERRQLAEDALTTATGEIQLRRDLLEKQADLATTTKERKDKELQILELQYQEEKLRLEAIRDNTQLRDAEREMARLRLAQLDAMKNADKAGVERQYQGPLARYRDEINSLDINEELEEIQVKGLKGIEDQLTSTISKVFEFKGAFGEVANAIIADLVRLAVQLLVIKPLLGSLGMGGGLGGIFGGIFGGGNTGTGGMSANFVGPRASGGDVVRGKLYRVNEGGVEGFQPSGSGKIVPLGRMRGAGGGGTTILQQFTLDARYGITTPDLLRHVNQVATTQAARAGRTAFEASQRNLPKRFRGLQKLGS